MDEIVFVKAHQLSYFDADRGEPVIVEDDQHAAAIARKPITERERQKALARLVTQAAKGEMMPGYLAVRSTGSDQDWSRVREPPLRWWQP